MEQTPIQAITQKPLFTPTYLNIEYVFQKIVDFIQPVVKALADPQTWTTIGFISMILSFIFITIIIYSLVRLVEIQIFDKHEIEHEIHTALLKQKEREKNANPKWHYISTLVESSNESDWRVAIIEADSMLEEVLRDKGLTGSTVSELLESARDSGYRSIQDAWDAHLVRNQIAHQGSDFLLSQIEARRTVKMFGNFFEELNVV